jgi:hypothetical protein
VKSTGWKLPYIVVFSTPMNREKSTIVNVSMEMIERSKVTFVTEGHL